MPITRITPLKNSPRPGVLDEVVAIGVDVHIERMDVNHYWLNIGGTSFTIRGCATLKQRPIAVDLTKD